MRGNNEGKEKPDLLVFGYACKLFRDDEKAQFIDSGQHLISWMGDDSLKIDRYDGRGALYDLTAHEPKSSYPEEPSSEEEAQIEKMCDEERWRSLYINEVEEATYKEEEAKRIQQGKGYGEVSYTYESTPSSEETTQEEPTPSKPFTPPPELNLPPEMKYPETVKQNAIIEKTALFLAQQGSQMEILMKVKQKGNKYFDFLSHNDVLHDYYKHIKNLIKTGSYVPKEQFSEEDSAIPNSNDEHYLHPSLVNASSTPKEPSQPPSEYLRKVIDKMITYVIRNGPKFEEAIRKLNDSRFSFLVSTNPHHDFYKRLLDLKQNQHEAVVKAVSNVKSGSDQQEGCKSLKRKPVPVCFSIKKPKENEGLEVSSALPIEESSDEEEEAGKTENDSDLVINTLEKRIKTSSEITKQRREKKDAFVQNERKIKVAQFLKDLKKKGT